MEIELKNLDLAGIVQKAVSDSLIQKLDKVLPKMVEDILTKSPGYNHDNIVQRAIRSAVETEVERLLAQYITLQSDRIHGLVQSAAAQMLNPIFVADCVTVGLEGIKIAIHPFRKVKPKTDSMED